MEALAPGQESPRGEIRTVLRLAAPIAATQAGFALMGLVDTAVVGRLGASALGAVGLGNGFYFTFAVLGIGAMMGLDPLFAQALGARDGRRARELIWQSVWLSLLVTAVVAVPLALSPLCLRPAGIPEETAGPAAAFIWIRTIGLWPMMLFAGLRSYLQAAHVTRALVVATVVANVANLFLDLWLVFGGLGVPPLGSSGSALSTVLCTFLQAGIVIWAVSDERGAVTRVVWGDLRKALRVGAPVGLQMFAEVGVFGFVGLLAGRLSATALAAHQIAIALASFTFCAAVGVGQAGSVRVGWAIGARNTPAARRSGLLAFGAGGLVMSVSALAFALVPTALARLMSDQADVVLATVPLLGVCAVFQLSDGVQAVGAGVLRGAGDTRFPFLANVLGHYAVGLPIAMVLGMRLGLGVIGLWWGLCAGLTAVAVALLWRFLRLSSREIVPLEDHPLPLH